MNVLGKGTHAVCIAFIVDREGNTGDIYLVHSCEWSGDNEVIRLIRDSPTWEPAIQNGKKVIYRQKQWITYEVN
jgi:protein TonB